ncbi:hypothetical protein [Pyrobaculum islandicum]|uniref:hypothetical protein n=1 Tax=Pyrobaculum islandicum TaxID=2277 RepID=UPI0014333E54|nr:hypothetical protein [Pyrobaculum islandicum]
MALAKYVENTVMPNIKCSIPQDIAKALPTLGNTLTGCFDTAATLQSFCIHTAIVLALTTAIAAGLAYAISKTYQAIAP